MLTDEQILALRREHESYRNFARAIEKAARKEAFGECAHHFQVKADAAYSPMRMSYDAAEAADMAERDAYQDVSDWAEAKAKEAA